MGAPHSYSGRHMPENKCQKVRVSRFIHFLPSLHLIGCAISLLTHDLEFMVKADLPISIVFVGLAYRGLNPLAGLAVFGTLWWYVLSLVIRLGFRRIVRTLTPAKTSPE